jgi:hypothetical protein
MGKSAIVPVFCAREIDGDPRVSCLQNLGTKPAFAPILLFDPSGPILPFSNRGHERKRFFPAFLSSWLCRFLLFDRAAGFLPPRPFSNRGHERKRFFTAFLSSLLCRFLLFDRAAGFLPPRP